MPNIGTGEIILLLLLALLLFGAKRLPEIGRSLGHGMREFKNTISGDKTETHSELAPPATGADTQTVVVIDGRRLTPDAADAVDLVA